MKDFWTFELIFPSTKGRCLGLAKYYSMSDYFSYIDYQFLTFIFSVYLLKKDTSLSNKKVK